MINRLFFCVALVAGCNAAQKPTPTPTPMPELKLPDISVIGDSDKAVAPAPTCANGWQLTAMPRQGSNLSSALDKSGVWHFAYSVGYFDTLTGTTITALRTISSDSPDTVQTVGWAGAASFPLLIGADDVPQLFFSPAVLDGGPVSIERARFIGGAWKVDANPVWTGVGEKGRTNFFAAFDPVGAVHVVFSSFDGTQLAVENSDGSWTLSSIAKPTGIDTYGGPGSLGVDANGADHLTIDDGEKGSFYVDNVGGAWHSTLIALDGALAFDSKGQEHLINNTKAGLSDHHQTGGGWSDDLLGLTNPAGFTVPVYAAFDAQDKLALVLTSTANNTVASDFTTNASGSWVTTPLPSQVIGFVLDGKPLPRFNTIVGAPGNSILGLPAFFDSCP